MTLSELMEPEPNIRNTRYNPDNVIHLPKIDRVLPCGWKVSELKLYCRLAVEDSEAVDRVSNNG